MTHPIGMHIMSPADVYSLPARILHWAMALLLFSLLLAGLAMVQSLRQQGQRMKDAVRRVAEDTGLSRNELYQAALQEE